MKTVTFVPLLAAVASATYPMAESMASMYTTAAPAVYATATAAAASIMTVTVGGSAGLVYTPEFVSASIGSTIRFKFLQTNHSVTQSSFSNPCIKMTDGMDSDFMPNPDGVDGVFWDMQVSTMDPIWMYCKQKNGTHCGKGMVFAVNPDQNPGSTKTFEMYKQLAIQQNGTDLATASIVASTATLVSSTVTIEAGTTTAAATVAAGTGVTGAGTACSCACLCGVNSFPAAAAVNNFGGFAGMLPAAS